MFPIFWQKEKRERQERERKKGKREREKQGKMQSNRSFVGKKKKVNPGFWTGFKHSLTAYRRIYTEHA